MADKNYTAFQRLLLKAIGPDRTQKEFAEASGVSYYYLNKLLNKDTNRKVTSTILSSIADASRGTVTLSELQRANLAALEGAEDVGDSDYQSRNIEIMQDIRKGIEEMSGSATRYSSIQEMFDMAAMLFLERHVALSYQFEDECAFDGKGYKNAESYVNVSIEWSDNDVRCLYGVTVFFCKTVNGGYIISQTAFDLPTLFDMEHPLAGKLMLILSEKRGSVMSDYRDVYLTQLINKDLIQRRKREHAFFEAAGVNFNMDDKETIHNKISAYLDKLLSDVEDDAEK